MAQTPSIVTKKNDTYEPLAGRLFNNNGLPVDLTDATLRFLAKSVDGTNPVTVIGENVDDGICVNVEDVDGPGDSQDITLNDGTEVTVPENRGRWRFEPTPEGVLHPGLYECEIEATFPPDDKTLTFPSRKADNPVWQIDEDID